MRRLMQRIWIGFLAYFRLSEDAVCDVSLRLGQIDLHDYRDGLDGEPWHFHVHTCRRCGKQFTI